MFVIFRPLRLIVRTVTDAATPRQLAMGFSFGMLIGLVPKGNLTAIALSMLLCASRVNLGAAALAIFAFSWVGAITDSLTHDIGMYLLSHETLHSTWTSLYNTPMVQWTGFNNTVVLGSLVLGIVLAWPVYRATLPGFERFSPKIRERVRKYRIGRILFGAEWADRLAGA